MRRTLATSVFSSILTLASCAPDSKPPTRADFEDKPGLSLSGQMLYDFDGDGNVDIIAKPGHSNYPVIAYDPELKGELSSSSRYSLQLDAVPMTREIMDAATKARDGQIELAYLRACAEYESR